MIPPLSKGFYGENSFVLAPGPPGRKAADTLSGGWCRGACVHPLGLTEKLTLNLEPGHDYVSKPKSRFKPLTGSPTREQAVSRSHLQALLCQQNRQDCGPRTVQCSSATRSPCRLALGPEHGGERDPISDPFCCYLMFGPVSHGVHPHTSSTWTFHGELDSWAYYGT